MEEAKILTYKQYNDWIKYEISKYKKKDNFKEKIIKFFEITEKNTKKVKKNRIIL